MAAVDVAEMNEEGPSRKGPYLHWHKQHAKKSVLSKALKNNVFAYGHKAAADQIRTSYERLTQYVGTTYGQDISNVLLNKTTLVPQEPVHKAAIITGHDAREQMIR
jgi:hypothetical protein